VPPQLAALMPDQTAAGAPPAGAGVGASSPPSSPTTVPQGAQVDTPQDGIPMTPARPQLVYAIGKLGYDFGTEARRDSFKQLMDPVVVDNVAVPANPYDSRQMVAHLDRYPSEAQALIWTLNLELTPLYAIVPIGPFAGDVYQSLRQLLEGEIQAPDADEFDDRVSLPGRMSDRQVRLFSGQVVPVVEVDTTRGLYGWRTNWLTTNAVEHVKSTGRDVNAADVEEALGGFLNRIYYDMRNIGVLSRDRALNFAATNAFQAASAFAEALAIGMHLDDIQVEPSPYARQDADAWDVKLKFFDPENLRRARRVFRFTVDVSDSMPVTLGDVRTWPTSS
jgi:cyanobactin maturation PatA/PatG family protease